MMTETGRPGSCDAQGWHEAGLTARHDAKAVAEAVVTFRAWESGGAGPTHDDPIRPDETAGRAGSSLTENEPDAASRDAARFPGNQPSAGVRTLIERQQRELEELRRLLAGEAEVLEITRFLEFPVVGTVSAGNLDEIIELSEEKLALPEEIVPEGCSASNSFALRVSGDSMIEAAVEPGSYVLVRRTTDIRSGDLVVVVEGNTSTLKRYIEGRDGPLLMPENRDYRPIRPSPDARIIGRVELIIRRP